MALCVGATACDTDTISGPGFGREEEPIIGGFRAESPFWNHTGALVFADSTFTDNFCTATLISPETVVTAKHCVDYMQFGISAIGLQAFWRTGLDVENPTESIPVAAIEMDPVNEGGFVGFGQDVAVVHLDRPALTPPARVGQFDPDSIGERMLTLGYGVHGAGGLIDTQRRIGRETVNATEGRILEALLGSFENFVEWALTGSEPTGDFPLEEVDETTLELLQEDFDGIVLLPGQEAVTGLSERDTQSCNGDSGGPLARLNFDGQFETVGVVSGGLGTNRSQCEFGTVFATFGPSSFEFLSQAVQWEDPCGDAPTLGVCDGNTVRRCETSFEEGTRVPVEQDCAERDQLCVEIELGAFCGTVPSLPLPAPVGEDAGAPSAEEGPVDEVVDAGVASEESIEEQLAEARAQLQSVFRTPESIRKGLER